MLVTGCRKCTLALFQLSSAALLLQFHAELNRLDAFDQSLAQVIAAERFYQTPVRRPEDCQKTGRTALRLSQPDKTSKTSLSGRNSQSSFQPSSIELPISHQKVGNFEFDILSRITQVFLEFKHKMVAHNYFSTNSNKNYLYCK